MDQKQLDALASTALEGLARQNYGDFFYLSHGKQWGLLGHQKYITGRPQKIIDREQKYYIIEIPPQHGKSTIITETFPAYCLMRHPDSLVMVVSYSKELFQKFGRKNHEKFRLSSDQLFGL